MLEENEYTQTIYLEEKMGELRSSLVSNGYVLRCMIPGCDGMIECKTIEGGIVVTWVRQNDRGIA